MKLNEKRALCFAQRFRELRIKNNYTQRECSEKLASILNKDKPFNLATIYYWEMGKRIPSYNAMEGIAEMFNVSPNYLKGISDEPEPAENNFTEHTEDIWTIPLTQKQKAYFCSRFKKLRIEAGYRQKDLCKALADVINKAEPFSLTAISYWESGLRTPSSESLFAICKLFKCTRDYLIGLTNNPLNVVAEGKREMPELLNINLSEITNYHNTPLFVTDKYGYTGWVLVNAEIEKCIANDLSICFNDIIEAKAYQAPYNIYDDKIIKDLDTFMAKEIIWVEMLESNEKISNMYNGWYRHNEEHTLLIKNNNSKLTLPYSGLNITYLAW